MVISWTAGIHFTLHYQDVREEVTLLDWARVRETAAPVVEQCGGLCSDGGAGRTGQCECDPDCARHGDCCIDFPLRHQFFKAALLCCCLALKILSPCFLFIPLTSLFESDGSDARQTDPGWGSCRAFSALSGRHFLAVSTCPPGAPPRLAHLCRGSDARQDWIQVNNDQISLSHCTDELNTNEDKKSWYE